MAKRVIDTEIEINVPPERVWSELEDFASYPEWNPFLVEIAGTPVRNSKLRVVAQPPGKAKFQFRPRVLVWEPNRELTWLGRIWFPGIFDGVHSLKLEPLDGGRTLFRHREEMKGMLIRPLRKTLDCTEQGFKDMNVALKQRAEA